MVKAALIAPVTAHNASNNKHLTGKTKSNSFLTPRRSKKSDRPYLGGLQALCNAINKLAVDEISRRTRDIPTNSEELQKYLSRKLGGSWEAYPRNDTDGCMGAYYSAVRNDDGKKVFVKLARPTLSQRIIDSAMSLGPTEVAAYTTILPWDGDGGGKVGGGISVPYCHLAATEASKNGSRYAIVLEELDPTCVHIVKPGEKLSIAKTKTMLGALAAMHVEFWGNGSAIPARNTDDARKFVNLAVSSAMSQARKNGLIPPGSLAERVIVAGDELGGLWGVNEILHNVLHPELRTLVHGDAHGGNLYFIESEGDGNCAPGLLDWQCYRYGNPIDDVAAVLMNVLSTEDFKNHANSLILHYIHALKKEGIPTSITKDQVMEGIHLKVAYWMLGCLLVIALPGEESKKELCKNSWRHYISIAEHIGSVEILEGFAAR